jgi:hypothetical protein
MDNAMRFLYILRQKFQPGILALSVCSFAYFSIINGYNGEVLVFILFVVL